MRCLILMFVLTSCVQTATHDCDDGVVCPRDRVCNPHGGCVLPEQLADCANMVDGTPCTLAGAPAQCLGAVCLPIGCGNGVVEVGEACDDGNQVGGDLCSAHCDSTERCGNAFLDSTLGEECDCGDATLPDAQRPPGCEGPNSDAPGSQCLADCTLLGCGDGVANGLEDCDGTELRSATCESLGYYGGLLACLPSCRYDTIGCAGYCGDGTRNGLPGAAVEACDGADLGNLDCTSLGFYTAGQLTCNAGCFLDASSCSGRCGDGLVNGPEDCDGAPPAQYACASYGHDAGQVACARGCTSRPDHCADIATHFEAYPAGGTSATSVWGVGRELFATSDSGVLHTTGGVWSVMPGAPTFGTSVWGTSPSDVFVVGSPVGGAWGIYHYDGSQWSTMTAPGTGKVLWAVWGTAHSNVYAVGASGTVLLFNGTSWTQVATPIPTTIVLAAVWLDAADDVVVVGNAGARFRWNGSTWLDQSGASSTSYVGVWGTGPTDIYAATTTSIEHFTGSAWTSIVATPVPLLVRGITGIPGEGAIVYGEESSLTPTERMFAYVDGRWLEVPIPGGQQTSGYAASTGDRVVVPATSGFIVWQGAIWTDAASSTILEQSGGFAIAPDDIYVVGLDDGNGTGQLQHYQSGIWSATTATKPLISVWASDPSTVVAVGQGGIALHGSGISFTPKSTGTANTLYSVWGAGGVFYAVGTGGKIIRYSGSWSAEVSGTVNELRGVWGAGTTVFAVGGAGTILRRTGSTWSPMTSNTASDLYGIWGRSASDVYAVGSGGAIVHFDGTTWMPMPTGQSITLLSVFGGAGALYAASDSRVLQYVGGRWIPITIPIPSLSLVGLTGSGVTTAFVGAMAMSFLSGTLFRPAATETSCTDLWDDDDDGLTDCADTDCAGDAGCSAPGGCRPAIDVACGATYTGTTDGGAQRFPFYGSGCAAKSEGGPETFLRVRRTLAGPIQVTLSGFTGDLDLVASDRSTDGACIADERCLASSQTAGSTESITFTAGAATDYIVIVDGSNASAFSAQVTCP